jgi:hypothetical protein
VKAKSKTMARGPADVARDALAILESMRGGEPVDEEIADVLRDACWESYANGLANEAYRLNRKRRAPHRAPAEGEGEARAPAAPGGGTTP